MILYVALDAWFGFGSGKGVFTKRLAIDFVENVFSGLGRAYCVKLLREARREDGEKL